MSFVVPPWVLWLQVAYSLWTFLNAKFFRIPFISISMLWHGYERTWFRRRKYLLLDGMSRETGWDCQDYDNEEERKSHSFSIDNNYDMRFKMNNKDYRFCASFETGKPLKFLHFAKHYQLVTQDIVLMGKYHLVKAVKPEAMLKYVLTGGTMKTCEEYCIVDHTCSELLNDNFMRILSIFPLVLQAKGFDQLSTLASAILVMVDIFSYYFNFVWRFLKSITFKYMKLLLGRLDVRYRVFIHEHLNTGSDSFLFCDDSMKKSYYKNVDKFMVVRGCEIPLEATTTPLSEDGDLSNHQEIKMNLNNFIVETEIVVEGYYNITITDNNYYREERQFLSKKMTRRIVKLIVELMRNHDTPESLVILASASDLLLRATDGMLVDGEACTLPQLELLEATARAIQPVLEWGESGVGVADGLSNLLKCRVPATVRCLSHPSAHVRALSTSVLRDILHTGSIKSSPKPVDINGIHDAACQYLVAGTDWQADIEKCLTWEAHRRLATGMPREFLDVAAKELGCTISL